jgi:hypothetical protein
VADVSITPSGAGLSATGYTGWGLGTFSVGSWSLGAGPTVVFGSIITPGVYNVNITGYELDLFFENIVSPTGGTSVVGSQPSVVIGGQVVITPTGSVTLQGYAPTDVFDLLGGWSFGPWGAGQWGTNDQNVYLTTGSVSITGYAVSLVRSNLSQPDAAVLSFTGSLPEVSKSVAPNSGIVAIEGQAPGIVYGNIIIPTGGIGTIGSDPTVIVAGTLIITGQGSVNVTGYAPTTEFGLLGGWGFGPWGIGEWGTDDTNIDTVTGTISFTGYAPSAVYSNVVVPTGGIAVVGSAPSVVSTSAVITPDTGFIEATGQTPFLGLGVVTSTGAIQFTGQQGSLVRTQICTGDTGTVILTGQAPTSVIGRFSVPATGTAQIINIEPFLGSGIVTATGTINITGRVPEVVGGSIKVPTGAAVVAGSVPSIVVSGRVITIPGGGATLSSVAPSAVISRVITTPKGSLTLVGGTATLSNPNWNTIDTSQTPGWVQIAA